VSAELRALLAGASPAPWEWLDGGNGEEGDELQDGQGEQVASGFRDDINLDAPRGAAPPPGHITDGRLCAAMRNEIEALLDERDAAIRRAASLDAARLAMEVAPVPDRTCGRHATHGDRRGSVRVSAEHRHEPHTSTVDAVLANLDDLVRSGRNGRGAEPLHDDLKAVLALVASVVRTEYAALLDERDAAIRRAEEAERERVPPTSRRVLQQPEPAYLAAIIEQFEIIVGSLTDEHLKEHAQTGLDAALRSQESQAPRRDVPSVNAHPHGEPTLPFEDRQWSMPPETDARG